MFFLYNRIVTSGLTYLIHRDWSWQLFLLVRMNASHFWMETTGQSNVMTRLTVSEPLKNVRKLQSLCWSLLPHSMLCKPPPSH